MTKFPKRCFLLWIKDTWVWKKLLRCEFLTGDLGGNLATGKSIGLQFLWFCISSLFQVIV